MLDTLKSRVFQGKQYIKDIKNADIKKGDKICQLIIVATPIPELVVSLENDRLNGGFGSTGR